MDVDVIWFTLTQTEEYKKKGLCFKCVKSGLIRDCSNHGLAKNTKLEKAQKVICKGGKGRQ